MEPKTQKHLPSKKNIVFLLLIQFLVGCCMLSYVRLSDDTSFFLCPSSESIVRDEAKDKLVILLWAFPFGVEFPLEQCQESYGISGCYLTAKRTWYEQADAVIFHHREVCQDKKQLPQIARPPLQSWVWLNLESPSHSPNLHLMDNLMNFTMSYRLDSDIFTPYGRIEILKEPQNFSIPVKSKLVSWVVSNWNPWSKRVKYYEELKKHIQVDVFGQGHKPLDQDKKLSTISQYKFYLAFENSQHEDYITEMFWTNALQSTTVPVVLGTTRKNYERFLPAEAFIHVEDFPNAQELAAYLKLLNSDDEKYQKYFDWRRRLHIAGKGNWNNLFCKACQYLKQKPAYRRIPSVAKWFK